MPTHQRHATGEQQFAAAGTFLDGLASQNFAMLATAFAPDVRLRALLPGGLREWNGVDDVGRQFERWFGDTHDYELVDATVGEVGGRLQLRWRLRLRAERLGGGWFTVEQQAYADYGTPCGIVRLDLLCTGYRPEDATHD